MNDDFTFDWAVLAPITDVETTVEHICVTHNLNGTWFESHPDGLPVKGCRITLADTSTLAVLTLQGYYEDQTHLRLQPPLVPWIRQQMLPRSQMICIKHFAPPDGCPLRNGFLKALHVLCVHRAFDHGQTSLARPSNWVP